MYDKTTSINFKRYGSIYDEVKDTSDGSLIKKEIVTNDKIISSLYSFEEPTCIEVVEGMASILISDSNSGEFKLFAVHRNLEIKPNMYFNIISMVDKVKYNLIIPSSYNLKLEFLNPPYVYNRILPTIDIPEIMAYYYTIKSPNYKFKGESHNIYELTFVDNGTLDTTIDGVEYRLDSSDLIIYGKNQFHTQAVNNDSSCSYLTIMFDMKCDDDGLICNKVFHCRKELYKAIRTFANNISSTIPYSENLILSNLHEIIIRLFQYDYLDVDDSKPTTEVQQRFQDELLEGILKYIDDMVCSPISIEELCNKFSISRSSLQTLFKNNLNTSPKKYINDLKLSKSKQLIKENKYTISEIAFMLGFNSIHYFSRAFTQHYEIPPSEYAQNVYKK
ncbi:MAG: helix-turn-helix transcriptional regulator [Clostridium sp.]|mgnify:CR=1 FL=1|uniref:helix-turn-helix domain-containing protein n=1 Tax=Clostridium sp. TaxID=1506 RepID=UPI0025C4C281|nr:helix-turn-helix domain-containing protein [Clostridium sp.]MCF0148750.1 helix-turn-helix transcriptional regulator [Clostridium sp.]